MIIQKKHCVCRFCSYDNSDLVFVRKLKCIVLSLLLGMPIPNRDLVHVCEQQLPICLLIAMTATCVVAFQCFNFVQIGCYLNFLLKKPYCKYLDISINFLFL